MKFIDYLIIRLKAGNGGNGKVSFRKETFVPKGGPSGGDGGDGGSIFLIGDKEINTLIKTKHYNNFKNINGKNGEIKKKHGKKGENKYIKVPLGTIIFNNKNNEFICEIIKNNQKFLIAKGGKGGRGNAKFVNSKNRAPTFSEKGEKGEEIQIRCELKFLADVGLVGLPNSGKSTLLSKLSKAKPKIGNYKFTTLFPQLGLVNYFKNNNFIIADLPGLIENSSKGKGLGYKFLKHIERCKIIIHILDMSGNYNSENVIDNYLIIKKELKLYNKGKLFSKPNILVANKMDINFSKINLINFKKKFKNIKILEISGLLNKNLDKLLNKINLLLNNKNKYKINNDNSYNKNDNFKIYKFKNYNIKNDIQILNLGNNKWEIKGEEIFKIYNKISIFNSENLFFLNKNLEKLNVFNILRKKGIKKNDIVKIYNYELEWIE